MSLMPGEEQALQLANGCSIGFVDITRPGPEATDLYIYLSSLAPQQDPGAFPADDVPRTHNTNTTSTVPSAGEPRTEKLHGDKHSPDYTYGGKDSSLTGGTGSHGRQHEGGLSQHGDVTSTSGKPHVGIAGSGHNTTGTHGHNKLSKDAPYDEYATGVGGSTSTRGAHGTHGGLTGTGTQQEAYGNHGTTSITGNNHGSTGMTGSHGAGGMTGGSTGMTGAEHGTGMTGAPHGTGMTGATHGSGMPGPSTGMTGSHGTSGMTGANTEMTGNHHGTPGMMTGATGSHDNRYDKRINPGTPTTGAAAGTGGPGMTSNMAHRPADGANTTRRDHKVDEYDAPTNSSGRGQAGLAGAAGGVAASQLANRHHKDEMGAYNTPGASSTERGLNTAGRWHNSDPTMSGNTGAPHSGGVPDHHNNSGSMLDPTGSSATTHGATGSAGHTSMLDPHNTTSRTTYGHDTGHHSHHGHRSSSNGMATGQAPHIGGGAINEYAAGAPELGMTGHHGAAQGDMPQGGVPHDTTRGGVPHEAGGLNSSSHMIPNTMGSSSKPAGNNTSSSHSGPMGGVANSMPGMGDGHHGPGHASAKVLHRCDHCGNDNDISRYFSKEAAYRMS
ncbi:hypothetical protein PG994_009518 [Apiospora phragmitis]|uniref:Uncharacterized protein n=1 Tax=Apiospora phragmitis TaxID=2905665 RepID=A0ABR1U6B9_9PEZI